MKIIEKIENLIVKSDLQLRKKKYSITTDYIQAIVLILNSDWAEPINISQ